MYVGHQSALGGSVLGATKKVFEDPYLAETISLVQRIDELAERDSDAGPERPGIGLEHAVAPLRAFVAYRERPWLLPLGALVAVGLPLLAGYGLGRHST